MAPIYRFAVIQMQPKPVDPEANFARASQQIRAAASHGCHVAILPEYHLTSWVPEHPSFLAASRASEAYLPRYQALARELHISIIPGTICESHNDELRNMAHFIEATTGSITASYQKKNLWHPERPHLAPGKHLPHTAFDTPLLLSTDNESKQFVRAGLLVCWDLAFPEAFRALLADGAQIVFVPSFWKLTDLDEVGLALNPRSESDFLNAAVVCRAFENTACVVFCNAGGCSQVAMPIQGKLKALEGVGESKEMEWEEDGVSYVDVDLDVLRIAEENYKVREDIRGSGWHYGYEVTNNGNKNE